MISWQDVRNVLIYPLLVAGGIAWALLFVSRFRGCARVEAAWGAAIGLALAGMGMLGLLAVAVSRHMGPGSKQSSFIFFLAVSLPTLVIVAGAARIFWLTWKKGHPGDSDD